MATYLFAITGDSGLDLFGLQPSDEPDDLTAFALACLFSWTRLDEPDAAGERWGWWGDTFADPSAPTFGSRLSMLRQAKMSAELPEQVRQAAEDALAPMLREGMADSVDVSAARDGSRINLSVTIRSGEDITSLRFADLWEVLRG